MAKIEKHPTSLKHIYMIDWDDNGTMQEVAVVQETDNGVIRGILVDRLHPIDKGRLKKFVTSIHADKYPLWELLSQGKLNNGMNALDFFHVNYVKTKHPKGSITGGGLASVEVYKDEGLIGSAHTDPSKAEVAPGHTSFA